MRPKQSRKQSFTILLGKNIADSLPSQLQVTRGGSTRLQEGEAARMGKAWKDPQACGGETRRWDQRDQPGTQQNLQRKLLSSTGRQDQEEAQKLNEGLELHRPGSLEKSGLPCQGGNLRNIWQMLHLLGTARTEAEWWHKDTVLQVPNNLTLLFSIPTLLDT